MISDSLKDVTLILQAMFGGSLDDHLTSVLIAVWTSAKAMESAREVLRGSHSCPYTSVFLKLVQNSVAARFAPYLLTYQ